MTLISESLVPFPARLIFHRHLEYGNSFLQIGSTMGLSRSFRQCPSAICNICHDGRLCAICSSLHTCFHDAVYFGSGILGSFSRNLQAFCHRRVLFHVHQHGRWPNHCCVALANNLSSLDGISKESRRLSTVESGVFVRENFLPMKLCITDCFLSSTIAVMGWRMGTTVELSSSTDGTYNLYYTARQSHLEIWLGIIEASLPTFPPPFSKLIASFLQVRYVKICQVDEEYPK